MLFSLPVVILEAFACQSISASATLARYLIPIHRLAVRCGVWDARKAHLVHTKGRGRRDSRRRDGPAMLAVLKV